MSKLSQLLNNEELLTKAVKAETKDEAKSVLKEGGLEVNDAELDEIAGGLNKTTKVVLGVLGGTAAATAAGVTGYFWYKNRKKDDSPFMPEYPTKVVLDTDAAHQHPNMGVTSDMLKEGKKNLHKPVDVTLNGITNR